MSSYTGQVPSRALSQNDFNTAMTYLLTYLKTFPSEANALTSQLLALLDAQVYNSGTTYNPSGYTVPDCVYGSDGITYVCIGADVIGDNPVGSSSGDWVSLLLRHSDVLLTVPSGAVLTGGIIGGSVAQNATDPNKDLDIGAVSCWSDDADPLDRVEIRLAAKTIQLDVALESGTGALSSSLSPAANTGYHIFALSSADGESQTIGFDTSSSAANLLADHPTYTKKRWLMWWRTDASANFIVGNFDGVNTFFYGPASKAIVVNPYTLTTSWVETDYTGWVPDGYCIGILPGASSDDNTNTQALIVSVEGANMHHAFNAAVNSAAGDAMTSPWESIMENSAKMTPLLLGATSLWFKAATINTMVLLKIHAFRIVR
jgi:hypothetical protein